MMIQIQVPLNGAIERNTRRNLQKEVEMFPDHHLAKDQRKGRGLEIKGRRRKSLDEDPDLAAESEEGRDLVTGSPVGRDLASEGVALYHENDEDRDLASESKVDRDLVKSDNHGLDLV